MAEWQTRQITYAVILIEIGGERGFVDRYC